MLLGHLVQYNRVILPQKDLQPLAVLCEAHIAASVTRVGPAGTKQVRGTGRSTLFHTSLPLNPDGQWNLVWLQLLAQKMK